MDIQTRINGVQWLILENKDFFRIHQGEIGMDLKEQLTKIVSDNDLINVAYELFWKCYKKALSESPEESEEYGLVDANSVNAILHSTSYKLFNDIHINEVNLEYIVVQIRIYDKKSRYIGYYDACFDLDGTIADDFLVFE